MEIRERGPDEKRARNATKNVTSMVLRVAPKHHPTTVEPHEAFAAAQVL